MGMSKAALVRELESLAEGCDPVDAAVLKVVAAAFTMGAESEFLELIVEEFAAPQMEWGEQKRRGQLPN